MIETPRLKSVGIFIQTILSFVLSRKIYIYIYIYIIYAHAYEYKEEKSFIASFY